MKKNLLFLAMGMLILSCSGDDSMPVTTDPVTLTNPVNPANPEGGENKVLLLKVDAVTGVFEGGKELTFEAASTFTITTDYVAPGDFGSVKLIYDELDAAIFDGTIHWMGLGEMNYPENIDGPNSFDILEQPLPMPASTDFYEVEYGDGEGGGLQGMEPDHQVLWDAIKNLEVVKEYRNSNPGAKISLFLYTPSVGIGNPEEWDWFIILKN